MAALPLRRSLRIAAAVNVPLTVQSADFRHRHCFEDPQTGQSTVRDCDGWRLIAHGCRLSNQPIFTRVACGKFSTTQLRITA